LSPVDEYLSKYSEELKASTYGDGERKADIPSIDSVLFRVLAGFFGGFFLTLYGVLIYDKRRFLGASLIGLGVLSAWGALAYMVFTFDYSGVAISQSENDRQHQVFQHDSAIVPQKYLDTL
jgi:uncharacterized membrane protein YebE (DUF533 family)